jgi:cation transport ATPase
MSDDTTHADHESGFEWIELIRILFVAFAAAAVWFRVWEPLAHISVIGIAATLVGGYPIFKEAFENIVARKMTMELSMTIALVAALAIGEFFTALVITGFVLVAEVLEGLTVGRGRRAIQDLLSFLPRTVTVRRNGGLAEIASEELQIGDAVIVKPGGHVPVDGTVIDGRSFVEQAAITGEAMPIEKSRGDSVYAGTMNQSGVLEVKAEKIGRDTTFGRIVQAVERADPEMGYRSCLGIIRLGQQYSLPRMEAAAQRALMMNAVSFKSIDSMLRRGLDRQPLPTTSAPTQPAIAHDNIRGAEYFG